MRISDWSSDVCSSDLRVDALLEVLHERDIVALEVVVVTTSARPHAPSLSMRRQNEGVHLPWRFRPVRSGRQTLDRLGPDDLAALYRPKSDPDVCRYLTSEPRTREQVGHNQLRKAHRRDKM